MYPPRVKYCAKNRLVSDTVIPFQLIKEFAPSHQGDTSLMSDFHFIEFLEHLHYIVIILRKFYIIMINRFENIALFKKARFFFVSVYDFRYIFI